MARALRDGGHDVIYTGLRKTPLEIVGIVNDEDAEVLGISTLSGAHGSLIPKICDGLKKSGCFCWRNHPHQGPKETIRLWS